MIKGFLIFFSISNGHNFNSDFYSFSNDHLECRNDSKTVVDQYGNCKTEKSIFVKEKYNL
jgi:hypothetical protein